MAEEKRPTKYKGFRDGKNTSHKGNKKDTRKWCRGVRGRQHKKEWVRDQKYDEFFKRFKKENYRWHLVCLVCEKEFEYCYGKSFLFPKQGCKCGHHTEVHK